MEDRNGVQVLAPRDEGMQSIRSARPFQPFAPEVMAFLGDLSTALLSDDRVRAMPDVYAFGFWCRHASLAAMQRSYDDLDQRLGRGIVFHIAPGNVPVNFAYSLAAGLLAGNANIVRVPSEDFAQVRVIAEVIDDVMSHPKHHGLREHIRLVRYERADHHITADFSALCDVRVIWGGDASIHNIRQHPLGPRAFEVTFADRYSVCVIGADDYLQTPDRSTVTRGFYNDTYLFDQNACTAPHLVLWWGKRDVVDRAREVFWSELHTYVQERYLLNPKSVVDKWTCALRYAATHAGSCMLKWDDNFITRLEMAQLEPGVEDWHGCCGLFFESQIDALEDILPIITRRYQTLSYLGVDKDALQSLLIQGRAVGIDRIVPIGRTLDFSLKWDGYDLVHTLSRCVLVH